MLRVRSKWEGAYFSETLLNRLTFYRCRSNTYQQNYMYHALSSLILQLSLKCVSNSLREPWAKLRKFLNSLFTCLVAPFTQ